MNRGQSIRQRWGTISIPSRWGSSESTIPEQAQDESLSSETPFAFIQRDLNNESSGEISLVAAQQRTVGDSTEGNLHLERAPLDMRSPYEFNPGANYLEAAASEVDLAEFLTSQPLDFALRFYLQHRGRRQLLTKSADLSGSTRVYL